MPVMTVLHGHAQNSRPIRYFLPLHAALAGSPGVSACCGALPKRERPKACVQTLTAQHRLQENSPADTGSVQGATGGKACAAMLGFCHLAKVSPRPGLRGGAAGRPRSKLLLRL
jgi:hypothetical protein